MFWVAYASRSEEGEVRKGLWSYQAEMEKEIAIQMETLTDTVSVGLFQLFCFHWAARSVERIRKFNLNIDKFKNITILPK